MNTLLVTGKKFLGSWVYKTSYKATRLLLLLITSALVINVNGQADNRLVQAEEYFAAGDYYTAANLYGQFLNPDKKAKSKSDFPLNANRNAEGMTGKYGTKTDILYKQAESYRLANYLNQAAELYKQCFEKDSLKYASAIYWYTVCQRGLKNYSDADQSIRFFLNHAAGNPFLKEAEKEKQTLLFIKEQLSRPDTILYTIQKINPPLENEKGFFAPTTSAGQLFFTSTQTDSVAAGQNPHRNRLFVSTYNNENFQGVQSVFIESLDSTMNQGAATISADGKYLYFTQWKNQNGHPASSIYYSAKTAKGWGKPRLLSSVNQTGFNSKQPFCSPDGKFIFFASDRKGGSGGFDIWYAPIKEDGTTGEAINAGALINTAGNEQSPFYHTATSTLVFSSDRLPGMGGFDLFVSKKTEEGWKKPENPGYPVNSSRDDVYFFSNGEKNLFDKAFFSSDRGSECCLSTYTVTKAAKKKMITGTVRSCEDNAPLGDATVAMTDASGNVLQTKTDAEGRYRFALTNDDQQQFTVNKEGFMEKSAHGSIESINETAWHTDTLHNADLCIEKKKLVIKVENVVTVYFDFDRSNLKHRARVQLDSIYNILLEDSSATLQISGYTDGLGSVEYNAKLSDKRARACANYLIEKGIDPARITFESFGACCPVEMELINGRDNAGGRAKNRRALINIDKKTP